MRSPESTRAVDSQAQQTNRRWMTDRVATLDEKIDAVLARLRAGETVEFWGEESGDPWGGWSRWGDIYSYNAERDLFLHQVAESTWHTGEGCPSEGSLLTEEEVCSLLTRHLS